MAILELREITKRFGETEVLRGINLEAREGEFITLLGSSGCGKTTTLRIISGLESPDGGRVILEGEDVATLPPNKRDVNTVFQNYALFPHMTVAANVGYSLKIRKVPKAEIRERVREALQTVQLEEFAGRMPGELSGGQKQRVAIARSIINRPKVLLLDEPLGALDLQLRRQMQLELKRLQKSLGLTFIYITHDQEEALNMSDRIAVMRDGVFEQVGTPAEVYDRPKTAYVATFVGSANILSGTARVEGDTVALDCGGGTVRVLRREFPIQTGETAYAAVRSEQIDLNPDGSGIPAVVAEKSFAGGMLRIALKTEDGAHVVASRHGIDSELSVGDRVGVSFQPERACLVENR